MIVSTREAMLVKIAKHGKRFFLFASISSLAAGFYFRMIKAGLPYQDPTPQLTQKYIFHDTTGKTLLITGAVLLVVYIALSLFLAVKKQIVNSK